ncbi:MAG: TCR/Tet family MFS transporter [Telmatospirillum sp.]|nr:TCR/Tet family MFS transporter [Telmatospirillum sp.]
MTRSLVVLYAAVCLDAVGLGLVFPILPRLLTAVTGDAAVASGIGVMTALYAAMQVVFAPVLGALGDRVGRRPVLLLSLAGAALSHVVMALAAQFWVLLLGRAIAGLTSANLPVAMAVITDMTPKDQRARRFGHINAMFGAGFIIGPVLGGLLGDYGLALPFLAAAGLNAGTFLLALAALPDSRAPAPAPKDTPTGEGTGEGTGAGTFNPLRALRSIASTAGLLPVILAFFVLATTGEAYGTCWALWGADSFRWDGLRIGLSLGMFGVCQTLVQALLPGPATRLLGDRGAILAGLGCSCAALGILAFARQGWIVFVTMPVFALGGLGTPAFQALAARRAAPGRQGQLQGVLASAVGLASIVGPLFFSTAYLMVRESWPGAIWLLVAVLHLIAVPLVLVGTARPGTERAG